MAKCSQELPGPRGEPLDATISPLWRGESQNFLRYVWPARNPAVQGPQNQRKTTRYHPRNRRETARYQRKTSAKPRDITAKPLRNQTVYAW